MPSEERAAEGRPKGPLSAFAVPCWGRSGPFSSLGVNGFPAMERSMLSVALQAQYQRITEDVEPVCFGNLAIHYKLMRRNAEWSVRRRPHAPKTGPKIWPLRIQTVGIERAGLLAHSAIRAFQLLLPLLRFLALGLADNERTGTDVVGMVEIRVGLFGHDERNLREVDLNP